MCLEVGDFVRLEYQSNGYTLIFMSLTHSAQLKSKQLLLLHITDFYYREKCSSGTFQPQLLVRTR